MRIPKLSKMQIERMAYDVICHTGYHPPIPIEIIIEKEFGLQLVIDDLNRILKSNDDILGATFIDSKSIVINEYLASDESDKFVGRYNFTCAHELGHWVLHRNIDRATIKNTMGQAIFCRIADSNDIVEWQANCFAASLLMPESYVRKAFQKIFGSKPIDIYNVKTDFYSGINYDPCLDNWPLIARDICEAGNFTNVSKLAMIHRLEDLRLIKNHTLKQFSWRK
jgi:hypothetical protein